MKLCDVKNAVAFWCVGFKCLVIFMLTADGGSRGNPGPAGYGSVITENGKIMSLSSMTSLVLQPTTLLNTAV